VSPPHETPVERQVYASLTSPWTPLSRDFTLQVYKHPLNRVNSNSKPLLNGLSIGNTVLILVLGAAALAVAAVRFTRKDIAR
jgi:hypothetical protein